MLIQEPSTQDILEQIMLELKTDDLAIKESVLTDSGTTLYIVVDNDQFPQEESACYVCVLIREKLTEVDRYNGRIRFDERSPTK